MIEITMPRAGQSMEEGTIILWLKSVGDAVEKGEVIAEIETDKAVIEFESPESGVLLEILHGEEETVPVLEPIAILGEAGEKPAAAASGGAAPGKTEAPAGRVVPVVMPQAGQTMEEGTLVEWFVKPGDRIEEGQVIFEIETDKAAVEVEAVDAGRLARIVVGEGETVPVKTAVAYLAESAADVDAYLEAASAAPETPVKDAGHAASQKPQPQAPPADASAGASGRPKASPAARKAASEKGIDLGQIGAGSGPGGRILSSDVERAAPAAAGEAGVKRRAMTKMRRAIAANLELSKRTIPHFYAKITVDAGALMAFYAEKKQSFKLSINDIVAWCAARCAAESPAFRSRIEGGEILEFPRVNLGLAVGTDEGLLVPVVSAAEELDLEGFAAEARRVIEAARAGKLEGQGKGVFTVTNLGMFGIDEFSAIINPPESAILAVGAVREAAVSRDGVIGSGRVMTLTLSSDHRIIDGVMAARFLARLRELIEDPACVT